MNQSNDPALRIRDALDRAVRRSFDPTRLAAAHEAGMKQTVASRDDRDRGPLGRVPPVVQWIGVAAAVIAAVTGLRSLYLDLTAPDPEPVVAEARASQPPVERGQPSVPPRVQPDQEGDVEPTADATDTMASATHHASAEPVEMSRPDAEPPPGVSDVSTDAPPVAVAPAPAEPRPGAAPPQATQYATASSQPVPRSAEPSPSTRSAGGGSSSTSPKAPATGGAGVIATFPGAAATTDVGGVRVESLRLEGNFELEGEARVARDLGGTLVTILARGGRRAPPTVSPFDTARAPVTPRIENKSRVHLVLDVLAGSTVDSLSETQHALLGDDLDILPLADERPWEVDRALSFLDREFRLRSVVALDAVRIPSSSGDAETSFVAVVGDKLYHVAAVVQPTATSGFLFSLRVSRSLPARTENGPPIEATIRIEYGHVAVLAIPVPRPGSGDIEPTPDLFIAVSPGTLPFFPQGFPPGTEIVDSPEQEPILVSGLEPDYPTNAFAYDVHGFVRLRAVVGANGDVESVTILDYPPDPGGEYLAAAAAGAVRTWRYVPTKVRGRDVPSFVEITLGF